MVEAVKKIETTIETHLQQQKEQLLSLLKSKLNMTTSFDNVEKVTDNEHGDSDIESEEDAVMSDGTDKKLGEDIAEDEKSSKLLKNEWLVPVTQDGSYEDDDSIISVSDNGRHLKKEKFTKMKVGSR